jgi:hypothetical protein
MEENLQMDTNSLITITNLQKKNVSKREDNLSPSSVYEVKQFMNPKLSIDKESS